MRSVNDNSAYPAQPCFHELFERQAECLPDHLAVICQQQQLTYAELNARANQLAHYLRALGAGPEALIPICVGRSVEMAVGILGILKSGAAYVPVDPAYPADRIAHMLSDTAASLVVTERGLIGNLPHSAAQLVALDRDWPVIERCSQENPRLNVRADNLAYVIYTSGSTGRPKGVMLTQANLSHYVLALQEEFGVTPDDRYLHLASIAFSSSRRHLMVPLAHGATVVIATEEERLDPLALFRLIRRHGVTIFDAVPSFQRHCTGLLLELEPELRAELLDNRVRLILSASEPLLSDIPQTWMHKFRHPARHLHMIGQTETSGIVAVYRIPDGPDEKIRVVPAGRPIANTTIYLLDEQMRPVPPGEPGEMYISGAGLGRGYLNHPELTAEKFVANIFSNDPAARLCRTGDMARWLPDGNLESSGRRDFQFKIRGFRVEPGEIEAVLMRHAQVRDCAVVAREDAAGQKRLVAYVSARRQQPGLIAELRELVKQTLPDYMVPAAFVLLDALPLAPNGKTDRRALPAPDETLIEPAENYVAPRSRTEEIIASIWAEVLRLKRPGIHDHFFELGGHSLLASRVIARIRNTFRIEIPLRAVFESPTIAGLAARVEQELKTESGPQSLPLLQSEKPGHLPLSFAQQRLWFLDQLESGTATYNLRKIVRLKGRLDVTVLKSALQTIVDRHAALRTTFISVDGQPSQVVTPSLNLELPFIDLCGLPEEEREREARQIAVAGSAEPFDLTRGPLVRMRLVRLAADEHLLVAVFHHIICDGWSVGVFLRELGALYRAFAAGEPSPLPEPPVQYADYAVWQQQWLRGETLERQLTYWKAQLEGAPALLELPTDSPRPAVQCGRGGEVSVLLPAWLRDELKALSRREGATLFMTLLAAFEVLLWRYSGQEQVVIGTPIAGRTRVETEGLIGFFVNTLALRADLSGNPPFRELLGRAREQALGAYAHQDLPFEKLVEELQPERSLSYSPVFQVMFALQNAETSEREWGELRLTAERVPSGTAKFDLSLDVSEEAEGLMARLEYDAGLFEAGTIRRLAGHWGELLKGIVADPGVRIGELPLLTPEECRQLTVEWNYSQSVTDSAGCLHHLIEQQVELKPEAVAVAFGESRLTYHELNARANQVARYLKGHGVGPEVIVGLCVERSLEMVVGLLGILKAGGAYLPLDPNYPRERLAHMLSDAAVPVLLTQAGLTESLPEHTARVIRLDADWPLIAREPADNVNAEVNSHDLAYVIYTSGSTGKAKGVMVTHGSVTSVQAAWAESYQLSGLRSHLQMASFSFDVFTGDLVRALSSGAKLVLCPSELLLAPEQLYELLLAEEVEAAEFVPAVIRPLMQYLEESGRRLEQMKLVIVGSDTWQKAEYRRLRRLCGAQTRVVNSYGVTEATIDSTYFEATETELEGEGMVPIGRPFANTQICLLDANLQPVPVGVPGELYLGGAGLARGYLNRPELTAERFIDWPAPHDPQSKVRLYRTGDCGRRRQDGTIELLGRADQQVKLRGYRIELGEIESALKRHPAVSDCAVVVREDAPGDRRLVAYLVTLQLQAGLVTELRDYVRGHLPEYMVPSAFVLLDRLPLTPNGKVDRRALPPPDEARPEIGVSYVAPRTGTEEIVAGIWAELLKLERVGVSDNFFDLGGHSLLATRVIARLQTAFGLKLSLRSLFETPTVAGLAETINELRALDAGPDELARLLAELDEISEEEALRLITEETRAGNEYDRAIR